MKPFKILYVYDAMCGWCYGFSPVIKKLAVVHEADCDFDVISGGMVLGERAGLIQKQMAEYILQAIPRVEEYSGIRFGDMHKKQIAEGTLYQSSLLPSIALSTFKTYLPDKALAFASSIQYAFFHEGKSLEEDNTYIDLIAPYNIPTEKFIEQLHSDEMRYAAQQDFQYASEMGITGFPAVIGIKNEKYYLLARGFLPFEQLDETFNRFKESE
ncbi:MAG: DsbA family protein [Filimonas sp.]|nr:DsbA family protein [Filimonas sp.]